MRKGELTIVFLVGLAVGSFLGYQQYRYARDVCADAEPTITVPADATVPTPAYLPTLQTLLEFCSAGRYTCVGDLPTIAEAVHRHSLTGDIEPWRIVAIMLVENPWLDPSLRGGAGEYGLMQIMPLWRDVFPDCGRDLTTIEDNICVGTHVAAHYADQAWHHAHRLYNGCRGECPAAHKYADRVRELYGNQD